MKISAADYPRGDSEELEGGFLLWFPPSRSGFDPSHPLTDIPTAGGDASAAAAKPRIEAAGGAAKS